MTKKFVGFFCGTNYYLDHRTKGDKRGRVDDSYLQLRSTITGDTTLLGYDGCQVKGGGLFAYGVEEQAEAFINALKEQLKDSEVYEDIQINLIAHSRGCLSALLAIKKIQAAPLLKDRVKVTADLRDPVPGNLQLTTVLTGNITSANQLIDLSDCDILKKVYITLQEKPILPIAFDAVVSIFPPEAHVEIETIPGYHDVQQRAFSAALEDDVALFNLGMAKTLSILRNDGHQLVLGVEHFASLEEQQLKAYDALVLWAKSRGIPFGERDLHFGGKIVANNEVLDKVDVINWRHALLKGIIPQHVLYGTSQPHYNHRKSKLEYYCDLTQLLDKYLIQHPQQQELVNDLKKYSVEFGGNKLSAQEYKDKCQELLKAASVNDKNIIKAINYMCLKDYFNELDETIAKHVFPENLLYENLQNLKQALALEFAAEIESGKTIQQVEQSNALKITTNTRNLIESLYSRTLKPEQMVKTAEQYANDNIRLGRNWSMGSKVIVGVLICVAAAAIGCIIGAAIGGIALACGTITGLGALITAIVGAFIGGFKGSILGATVARSAVGLEAGAYGANFFFKPSTTEKQVQALANTVKDQVKLDTEMEPDKDEQEGGLSPA